MSEWLEFKEKESKPKTRFFEVISNCSNCVLGVIKWHPQWRHYCFFPITKFQTVHSDRCLIEIGQFVMRLNKEHKHKNKKPEMPYHKMLADRG